MTNATNLIHRLAELRAGVLYRIRLHFRAHRAVNFRAQVPKATIAYTLLRASLAMIDSCAEVAGVLPEVRRSTRRVYRRLLVPVAPEELTIGGSRRESSLGATDNALHAA